MSNAIMNYLDTLPREDIVQMIKDHVKLEKDGVLEVDALLRTRTSELRHQLGDFDEHDSLKWMMNVVHECYRKIAEESMPELSNQASPLKTLDEMGVEVSLNLAHIFARNFSLKPSQVDFGYSIRALDAFEGAAKELLTSLVHELNDSERYDEAKKVAGMGVDDVAIYRAEQANEEVAVVWDSTDCDGARISNEVCYIGKHDEFRGITYATLDEAVSAHIEDKLKDREGPMLYSIVSKHEAEKLETTLRDLGMEAFENGHPHVLSM